MKIENLLVALCVSVFAAYSCSPIEKPDVPDSETPVPDTESPEAIRMTIPSLMQSRM